MKTTTFTIQLIANGDNEELLLFHLKQYLEDLAKRTVVSADWTHKLIA